MKEIFKDISGFDGYYKVSNRGVIKSIARTVERNGNDYRVGGGKMNGSVFNNGYTYVVLRKDGVLIREAVHRLVADAFIPNPKNKPQVNHIDGNKLNNNAENLEWVTAKEQSEHAWDMGLVNNRGEKNGKSKISKKDVLNIKKLYKSGRYSQRKLADRYSISQCHVSDIINGRRWGHLNG